MPRAKIKKSPIQSHLSRIAGQVNGIGKMIDSGQDNFLVVGQIAAAKASLESLALKILREESKVCHKKELDRVIENLFRMS